MKHYLDGSIISPISGKWVNVVLAGAGGTGSQLLTGLARLHMALAGLGHPGIHVKVFDPDRVSEANIGRQMFSPADVGKNKASVLVTRVNSFMGLSWEAYPCPYTGGKSEEFVPWAYIHDHILITAVDSARARTTIAKNMKRYGARFSYWLDTGNSRNTGQVILGTPNEVRQPEAANVVSRLPTVVDLYDLESVGEEDQGPSCSLAQALEHQDLMINQVVAGFALQLLWQGFRYGHLNSHGSFIDLQTMRVNPLPIDPTVWERFNYKEESE